MKPIEEGCRAIVVNTRFNDGKIVNVGKKIGAVGNLFGLNKNHWEVDKPISYTYGDDLYHIDEYFLLRIDDDEQELSSWKAVQKVCGFIPNKQTVTE